MICGKCAQKQGFSLEDRKQIALKLIENDGEYECGENDCSRVLFVENGMLKYKRIK